MTTWKPGDVAIACVRGCQGVLVVVASDPPKATNDVVFVSERRVHGEHRHNLRLCSDVRPLVVIDPESAEDVKRLSAELDKAFRRLYPETYGNAPELDSLDDIALTQAALREFAARTPPKPAEPTGLGAVVEDADGAMWVLVPPMTEDPSDTFRWVRDADSGWKQWADMTPPLRVLSEGVTP